METQAAATFELPLHNDEKIGNKDTKRSVLLHICVHVKHEATGLMQQSSIRAEAAAAAAQGWV